MAYGIGTRSATNLKGVHPDLVKVYTRALQILAKTKGPDPTVICGVRTPAEQKVLYAQGRTKPGPKVTWTLISNHFINPKTKFGHAIDVYPGTWEIKDDKATQEIDDAYAQVARAMYQAAHELGIKIRWGANWDGDNQWREKGETDNPHFELVA